jgi:hypothetical protein
MRSPRILMLLALLSGACAGPADDSSDSAEAAEVGEDLGKAAASPAVQPAFTSVEDDCDFIALHAHPHPDALIAEYLERDSRGEFLQTEGWLPQATTCPGHLHGHRILQQSRGCAGVQSPRG